jgi:hypothetical protein
VGKRGCIKMECEETDCVDLNWIKLTENRIQSLMFILINTAESADCLASELL